MLTLGSSATPFCLKNQDDVEICLKDLRGKWVVLYFYPKDSTSGCTTEACDFNANLPAFENLDAMVLGISPDSTKSHRNFIAKQNLDFTLLSDERKEMLSAYGVWQEKSMYGRKYMGVVRTTYLIDPKGDVVKIWEKVKVAGHADQVKQTLEQLRKK